MEFDPYDILLAVEGNCAALDRVSIKTKEHSRLYFNKKLPNDIHAAEDLSQEVSIIVMNKLHTLSRPESFFAWLKRICKNHFINEITRNRPKYAYFSPIDLAYERLSDHKLTPYEVLVQKERSQMLATVMLELSQKEQQILRMFYFEGMKISEITKMTNYPEGTIKRTLTMGRRKLYKKITTLFPIESFHQI